MVHTTLGWFRPKFLVRTRKRWYSPATWFEPHCWSKPRVPGSNRKFRFKPAQSGVNHEAGSYHLFLVCTGKVVQTTKQWYEPSVVQTTLGWSGPLFLVQTTKTWSIPSFSRLLSCNPISLRLSKTKARRDGAGRAGRAAGRVPRTRGRGAGGHASRFLIIESRTDVSSNHKFWLSQYIPPKYITTTNKYNPSISRRSFGGRRRS